MQETNKPQTILDNPSLKARKPHKYRDRVLVDQHTETRVLIDLVPVEAGKVIGLEQALGRLPNQSCVKLPANVMVEGTNDGGQDFGPDRE